MRSFKSLAEIEKDARCFELFVWTQIINNHGFAEIFAVFNVNSINKRFVFGVFYP